MTRLFLVGLITLSFGCKKKPPTPPLVENGTSTSADEVGADGLTDEQRETVRELAANFRRVHFSLDSSSLDEESKQALDANAAILQKHPDITVEIQGHADERGTIDYNLALGQRRAMTVKARLVTLGVGHQRLPTMSWGEERPLDAASNEAAWSQNRRAEFRILVGGNGVVEGTL